MGEEVRITDYDVSGGGGSGSGGGGEEDERVTEWEDGLPDGDDLTPLSQLLISSELLSAFSITPEPYRSMIDVNRASEDTISNLQPSLTRFNSSTSSFEGDENHEMDVECEETADLTPGGPGGSGYRKLQRICSSDGDADGDGGGAVETETESDLQVDDPSARAMKRPRLVWTPQLHKRFVEVVAHLGVKNAVPKTIMQLMNVEGLTRENVASHLQKYRLYLKRMQGSGVSSSSDHLYSSTPVVQNSHESGGSRNGYHPMPYAPYQVQNSEFKPNSYPYNVQVQQGNWPGNGFDSGYHHGMTPYRK